MPGLSSRQPTQSAIFSLRQPVGDLPSIAAEYRLHVTEKPLDKFRPELGMVIHKLEPAAKPSAQRVLGDIFALPFGRDQIPEDLDSFEFTRFVL